MRDSLRPSGPATWVFLEGWVCDGSLIGTLRQVWVQRNPSPTVRGFLLGSLPTWSPGVDTGH